MSRKKLAMMYQPPSFSGGMDSPYSGEGGSSASQKSWRMNSGIDQSTCASMLKPMMFSQTKPEASETTPAMPRLIGPSCALANQPKRLENVALLVRSSVSVP